MNTQEVTTEANGVSMPVGTQPQGPTPTVFLTPAQLQEYKQALSKMCQEGYKLSLKINTRLAPLGALIPAGEWEEVAAEVHSVDEGEEEATGTLWLYIQALNDPRSDVIELVEFPSNRHQYASVVVLPYRSSSGGNKKSIKRERDENLTQIPHTQRAMGVHVPVDTTTAPDAPRATSCAVNPQGAGPLTPADFADALQGKKKRVELAEHLKVPAYCSIEDAWCVPSAFLARITAGVDPNAVAQEYLAAATQAQLAHNAHIIQPQRREQFEAAKRKVASLLMGLSTTTGKPQTKSSYLLFFDSFWDVAAWFVFAKGGQAARDQFLHKAHKAFREGFVDIPELLNTAMYTDSREESGNGHRGGFRARGRSFPHHRNRGGRAGHN